MLKPNYLATSCAYPLGGVGGGKEGERGGRDGPTTQSINKQGPKRNLVTTMEILIIIIKFIVEQSTDLT